MDGKWMVNGCFDSSTKKEHKTAAVVTVKQNSETFHVKWPELRVLITLSRGIPFSGGQHSSLHRWFISLKAKSMKVIWTAMCWDALCVHMVRVSSFSYQLPLRVAFVEFAISQQRWAASTIEQPLEQLLPKLLSNTCPQNTGNFQEQEKIAEVVLRFARKFQNVFAWS